MCFPKKNQRVEELMLILTNLSLTKTKQVCFSSSSSYTKIIYILGTENSFFKKNCYFQTNYQVSEIKYLLSRKPKLFQLRKLLEKNYLSNKAEKALLCLVIGAVRYPKQRKL